MSDTQRKGDKTFLDDELEEALGTLASRLKERGMSASITIKSSDRRTSFEAQVGSAPMKDEVNVLHARTSTSEGSHLNLNDD